jgi:glutaminyl-tRNA synthetase
MIEGKTSPHNFLTKIIEADILSDKVKKIVTRFPPEPNGYLHIGHAKSICLNFGLAKQFNGECYLRFDDTNPEKESQEYIDAIKEDVRWLGFNWQGDVRYSSNYFQILYEFAVDLIKADKAYVCNLSQEEAEEYKGNFNVEGKNSPYRSRTVEENLTLFTKMKGGEFAEGSHVLRAKIDMQSPNMNMRDPILYRIRHISHHQTGNDWCIYPIYDFTHGQSDAIEGVTHSICTLEFEDHKPLYDWYLNNLPVPSIPTQYEFARLNINYTITSKRKLKRLVDEHKVSGWSDPRLPTISGLRRRGVPAVSLRNFCDMVGTNRASGVVDVSMLDHSIRTQLNEFSPRAMCVIDPLKVEIVNLPKDFEEKIYASYHPELDLGQRILPMTQSIYIDKNDFKTEYSKKFKKKFSPTKRIRLRHGYVLEALSKEDGGYEVETDKDENETVTLVRAKLIKNTLGTDPEDGNKPKGVVHWVSAQYAKTAEIRLYSRLFNDPEPDAGDKDFMQLLNPNSLLVTQALIEPSLVDAKNEEVFQFEREGYFVADKEDHTPDTPVFNLTIGLREDKSLNQPI